MLAATLAEALASANHQRKQKQASNISRNRAVQGIEHWKARAEAAEANLARAREIMKPGGDWRVVPAEPTEAMVEAAVGRPDNPYGNMYSNIYRAMLSAAPLPPEQGDGNGG